MAKGGTFDAEKRAQARRLFDQEKSCRAIAEALGVSTSTISRWAKNEGLQFDRSQTAAATAVRIIDLAAARSELTSLMFDVAKQELGRANKPYVVFSFGGQFNDYAEHTLDLPPAADIRSMMTTAGIAHDKITKVLEKTTTGTERAESLVDHLEAFFDKADSDADEE